MAKYKLSCASCNWNGAEDSYLTSCPDCNKMLEVCFQSIPDQPIDNRYTSLFKYHRVMPFEPSEEGISELEDYEDTPVIYAEKLSRQLGIDLFFKDETVMPTGTWKDREGFLSLYRLIKNGIDDLLLFSSGNTGTSLARSAGIFKKSKLHIVIPEASKKRIESLSEFYDHDYVQLHYYPGSNDECIEYVKQLSKEMNYPEEHGFTNYARREGLKLVGLELILGWGEPYDWYVQPVAGGIGIYSLYKAYSDLGRANDCPRMLGVQADICAPMVNAWRAGATELEEQYVPKEVVPSDYVRVLRTRRPADSYPYLKKIMDKVDGRFEAVSDAQIHKGLRMFYEEEYFRSAYHNEGRLVGLEPATAMAGVVKAVKEGYIKPGSRVVLNVSGAAKSGDINLSWIDDLL